MTKPTLDTTKIIVASDIHGGLPDAKYLLKAVDNENADTLVLLGDVFHRDFGSANSDTLELAHLLNDFTKRLIIVKGNCDTFDDCNLLNTAVLQHDIIYKFERNIFFTHGHLYSPYKLPPLLKKGDIFFSGHTHIPLLTIFDGIIIANPGSVSLPRNGTHKGYAVIDKDGITLKTIDGNAYNTLLFNPIETF